PFAAHGLNCRGTYAWLSGQQLIEAAYSLDTRVDASGVGHFSVTHNVVGDDHASNMAENDRGIVYAETSPDFGSRSSIPSPQWNRCQDGTTRRETTVGSSTLRPALTSALAHPFLRLSGTAARRGRPGGRCLCRSGRSPPRRTP